MQVRRQIAGSDGVEVVVVAVDPVDRTAQRLVEPRVGGDVADAQPERHVRMARDNAASGQEIAVHVAKRPEKHSIFPIPRFPDSPTVDSPIRRFPDPPISRSSITRLPDYPITRFTLLSATGSANPPYPR